MIFQVLHGCGSDILWLQRDFGVYLVNVFDTGEAARVLQYPSFGLAHLLQAFCSVEAQKQYQVLTGLTDLEACRSPVILSQ